MPRGAKSTTGTRGQPRQRLTDGVRATQPDVSPDGERVVFVTNHHGTTSLEIGRSRRPARTRRHEPCARSCTSKHFDQAYAPRWSPDNRHVAYSVWKKGGYRDVRIVDTADGSVRDAHARPRHRRRPGLLARRQVPLLPLRSHRHHEHLRLRAGDRRHQAGHQRRQRRDAAGALRPTDARSCTSATRRAATTSSRWTSIRSKFLDAAPVRRRRGPRRRRSRIHTAYEVQGLQPADTLAAAPLHAQHRAGELGAGVQRRRGVGGHRRSSRALGRRSRLQTGKPVARGQRRLHLRAPSVRSVACTATAPSRRAGVWPTATCARTGSSRPSAPERHQLPGAGCRSTRTAVCLAYSFNRIGGSFDEDPATLNPYDTPHYPGRAARGDPRAWRGRTRTRSGFLWSVSAEKGYSVSSSIDLTHPALASDYRGYRARADFTTYVGMPWLRHHALALHASGGVGGGSFPGGPFYVGGFVDVAWLDQLRSAVQGANFLVQGGVALRGYPVAVQTGALLRAAQRRVSLPHREHRSRPVDACLSSSTASRATSSSTTAAPSTCPRPRSSRPASAPSSGSTSPWGTSCRLMMRVGYAKGLASQGLDKVYFVGERAVLREKGRKLGHPAPRA